MAGQQKNDATFLDVKSTQSSLKSQRLNPEVKLENCTGSKVMVVQEASSHRGNRGKKRKSAGLKKEMTSNKLNDEKKEEAEVIEKFSDMNSDSEEEGNDVKKASEKIKKAVYKKARVSAEKELKKKLTKYQSLADVKNAAASQIKAALKEFDTEKEELEKKVKLEKVQKAEVNQYAEEIVEIEIEVEVKRVDLDRLESKLMQKQVEHHLLTKSLEIQQDDLMNDHYVLEAMKQEQEERRQRMTKVEQQMKDLVDGVGDERAAEEAAVVAEEAVAAERARQKARNIKEARVEILRQEITKLEQDLECPLCFHPCVPPIYSCKAQHLVCSTCRPQLGRCGECRSRYRNMVRHRYAERDYGTLLVMQGEHGQLSHQLLLED